MQPMWNDFLPFLTPNSDPYVGNVFKVDLFEQERTWYTPEAWEHGGLRLKEEVKDEEEVDGSPAKKRVKKEAKA